MNYPPTTARTVTTAARAIHSQVGGLPLTGGNSNVWFIVAILATVLGLTAVFLANGRRAAR